MRRREFIVGLGSATAWPLVASAQQPAPPVIAFISALSEEASVSYVASFRAGLGELGFVEGRNVTVDYHWLEGQSDRVSATIAELVRRGVAVIATPGGGAAMAQAAKTATATIPIVFGVGDDPVRLGLVASLARPGGNATGMNIFGNEVVPKRLGLLRELVPKADRVTVLVNPKNSASAEATLREVTDAARRSGWPLHILEASTSGEIEAAFATTEREPIDALFVAGDAYFTGRRVQFATLATRYRIATAFGQREFAESGGLMSYGTDLADMYRKAGVYTGRILRGAKPADLPVQQATKFELVINLKTAKALGLEVPPNLLAIADQVLE
jgi:putative tryptophan/tyrosine transport system substrate-binding protein